MSDLQVIENLSIRERCAVEINTIKRETARVCLSASVEIGRILCVAKETMPHGEWGDWLLANVAYSQSTANNLMKLYREYGEQSQLDFFSENKMEIFGELSPSQALVLLALPDPERREFVESHDMESLSVREMEREIEALKNDIIKRDKELEYEKERADMAEADRDKATEEARKVIHNNGSGERELADLKKQLKAEKASRKESEEESRALIKRLRKELEEARQVTVDSEPREVRVEVPADVETDPRYQALMAEKDKLRKELALSDADGIRFRLAFDRFQEAFGECVGLLNVIGKKDLELYAKLCGAMDKVICSMNVSLTELSGNDL